MLFLEKFLNDALWLLGEASAFVLILEVVAIIYNRLL